jgi:hypothetical protein
MTTVHCQICARAIKAKNGFIAHHGYKRPGHGWQTASCMGARYAPYEVSRDRIPDAIDVVRKFIKSRRDYAARIMLYPPDVMQWGSGPQGQVDVPRPAGFDPHDAIRQGSGSPRSYSWLFRTAYHGAHTSARSAEQDERTLQKRFDEWTHPAWS